jgi:CSLREA domain-containing protein
MGFWRVRSRAFRAALGATVVALAFATASASAATVTVTTTGDDLTPNDGSVSLREAIAAINAGTDLGDPNITAQGPGAFGTNDTINFTIAGAGVQTIALGSDLPTITKPLTINGYSQPGSGASNTQTGPINATPLIAIDGQDKKTLVLSGGSSTVRGLVIYDAGDAAITLQTNGGNNILGNFLGTSPIGGEPVADPGINGDLNRNIGPGVKILSGSNDIIGGPTADRNVISGNGDPNQANGGSLEVGVQIAGGHGHTIDQNLIGTDKGGTVRVENRQGGVWANGFNPGAPVGDEIHDITVGGTGQFSGNVISGNADRGLEFNGAGTGNKVLKNRIGTDYSGTAALSNNGQGGIEDLDTEGLTIGDANGNGNLISGNAGFGLYLFGANHTIQGNKIGTNLAGTAAIPNGNAGIQLQGPHDVTIGGTTANARNLISGNTGNGIAADTVQHSTIQGNFIGTSADGTAAIPNLQGGINLAGGDTNLIGGAAAGAGNVISGNDHFAILLQPPEGTVNDNNEVLGNLIGTKADGTGSLPNDGHAIIISAGLHNVIGRPGQGNTIVNNSGDAVSIEGGVGLGQVNEEGNSVRGNSIDSNGRLGIDLTPDGVNANDSGDGDTGPNGLQNFPSIDSATQSASTVIAGSLNSKASTSYTIDFYEVSACDASGNGEGQTWLGSTQATTDANGNVSWSQTVSRTVPTDHFVTATATDPNGSTSEFSACRQSKAAPQQQPPPTNNPPPKHCKDRLPPITFLRGRNVHLSRDHKTLSLSGTSSDPRKCRSGVEHVAVSLSRIIGRRPQKCRFITQTNAYALTRVKSCRRPTLFRATGRQRWSFTFHSPLKPGFYRVQARGFDKAGNKETPNGRRNVVRLVIR